MNTVEGDAPSRSHSAWARRVACTLARPTTVKATQETSAITV